MGILPALAGDERVERETGKMKNVYVQIYIFGSGAITEWLTCYCR